MVHGNLYDSQAKALWYLHEYFYYIRHFQAFNMGDKRLFLAMSILVGEEYTIPFDDHLPTWTIKNFGLLYIPRKGDIMKVSPQNAALHKILLEYETHQCLDINWERKQVLLNGKPFHQHVFLHDYYFMAGDNVINSSDSRYWGLVPDDYIIGIVSYHFQGKKSLPEQHSNPY